MRNKRRGYGLMESVISLSIASLLITALTTVIPGALLANFKARETYRAASFAQSVLSTEQSLPFARLEGRHAVSQDVDGRVITGFVEVRPVEGHDATILKCVHVELKWREMGQLRQLTREVWVVNDET